MAEPFRVVQYLNQFFGGLGGEERAGAPPLVKEGPVGPGKLLQALLGDRASIVATIICGDNYFSEHLERVAAELVQEIKRWSPRLVVAGPAFGAGRYGICCGELCKQVEAALGIPTVTGMFEENPGVDMYRKRIHVVATGANASTMREALDTMSQLGVKLALGQPVGPPTAEGYFARSVRRNFTDSRSAAERAVEILVARLSGRPFQTEIPVQVFERVLAPVSLADLAAERVAVVTTGGLVPAGNPDRLEVGQATRWGRYSVEGLDRLSPEAFNSIHRGYDTKHVNADPHRLIPLDALREAERDMMIGQLWPYFYTTSGQGTFVNHARRMGCEIADELKGAGVRGVLLVST